MRALTPWSRRREWSTIQHEIDHMLAAFFGNDVQSKNYPLTSLVPSVESFVRDGQLVVRADLPGIDPKDVEVSLEGSRLTLKGERKSMHEETKAEMVHREVSYGRFERSIRLPAGVDPESINASYKDGVLEVTMKAPAGLTSKKVPITVH